MNLFKIKKIILNTLKSIAIIYLAILILMYFAQEKLLFHPKKVPLAYEYNFETQFEEKWTTVQGLKIHSLYFKAQDSKGVILYFHGNGCDLSGCGYIASEITKKTNWDVWILDYPGYGKSEGHINSEIQLHLVAKAVMAEVQNLNPKKIVIYGRSLGSGIATKLVSENNFEPNLASNSDTTSNLNSNSDLKLKGALSGLILETPYFSIKDLALSKYPFVPSFLLKYNFRSDLWIKNVRSPVLIFHGSSDKLIPIQQAKRLSNLIQDLTFVEIQEGTHDDLSIYAQYWQSLILFLEKI